jgi:hypothetical protein
MAEKIKANKKSKSFEETLWDSANKLRGSVEPSEYKHVVLSLIFLKFASDIRPWIGMKFTRKSSSRLRILRSIGAKRRAKKKSAL